MAEGTVRLISEGVTSSSTTLRLLWKRVCCTLSSALVSAAVHRIAYKPLPWSRSANLAAAIAVVLRMRHVGDNTSQEACAQELSEAWTLAVHALYSC